MRTLLPLLATVGLLGPLSAQDVFNVEYLCGKQGFKNKTKGQLVVTDSQVRFVANIGGLVFAMPTEGLEAFSNAGGGLLVGFCTNTKDEIVFLYSETGGKAEAVAFRTQDRMSPAIVTRIGAVKKPAPVAPPGAVAPQKPGVPKMGGDTLYYLSPSRSFNAGLPKFWGRVDWPASWPDRGSEVGRRDTGYVGFSRHLIGMSRIDYQRLDSATVAVVDSSARHRLYQSYLQRVVAAHQGEVLAHMPVTVTGECMLCVRLRFPRACSLDNKRKDSIRDGLVFVRGDFVYLLQVERVSLPQCEKYEPARPQPPCQLAATGDLLQHITFLEPAAKNIPGTRADAELQADIQLLLWREESKEHRDCLHETLRVQSLPLDSSVVIIEMLTAGGSPATAAQNLLQAARDTTPGDGMVHLERWVVKSCDTVTTYQVLLMPAAAGGTDIIVRSND